MSASSQRDEYRTRRRFFIGVEVMLTLGWCGLLLHQQFSLGPAIFAGACYWAIGSCTVLLLLVLPWLWATLRRVALIGWLMGAGSILYILIYGPGHH
ncbi:MAG TPA: hypothetical protein VGE41_03105 [Verrucomicrobiae bacterium]|jgi:hypothetical protein